MSPRKPAYAQEVMLRVSWSVLDKIKDLPFMKITAIPGAPKA